MTTYRCAKTEQSDIVELWQIVRGYKNFFSDDAGVEDLKSFSRWINLNLLQGVTVRCNSEIVGFCYIDRLHNGFGRMGLFTKRHTLTKQIIKTLALNIIPYFFKEYNLKMIYGLVRKTNRACIGFLKRIGFANTGTIEEHLLFNKKTEDVLFFSALRERYL